MWKLDAGDEVWNILYSGRWAGAQTEAQLSRCTGCRQDSWWRQAVPWAVQRDFMKEVREEFSVQKCQKDFRGRIQISSGGIWKAGSKKENISAMGSGVWKRPRGEKLWVGWTCSWPDNSVEEAGGEALWTVKGVQVGGGQCSLSSSFPNINTYLSGSFWRRTALQAWIRRSSLPTGSSSLGRFIL